MIDHTPRQWVVHLSHPNGWWRDTAQQLLVENRVTDTQVISSRGELAGGAAAEAYVRLHALWTLEGVGELDAGIVKRALAEDEAVRPQDTAAAREQIGDRAGPWTREELEAFVRE